MSLYHFRDYRLKKFEKKVGGILRCLVPVQELFFSFNFTSFIFFFHLSCNVPELGPQGDFVI